ncbi:Flp family type IVb pilin [Pelagibacterium sp. H642]|uniref:Flp family type IVb pilin n=1 Tax=Pelagibacterium sp. H642 TaxID=1881069 RepID=UPI0028155CC1|nr:Flp family type IVb pilin [Pelagibacterium sp. H642]WMT91772.1 Flp family type IVb pilin [Pelagibacterium sp. H642]
MNLLKKFAADESGATAIEYGLIAALMAVAVIAAITLLQEPLKDVFCNIGETLQDPEGGASTEGCATTPAAG